MCSSSTLTSCHPRSRQQLVPGQFLTCVCELSSTGHGIVVILLLVSAPWWVRLVQRLVHASWQEGLVPAHWWVELGPGPLVSRALSRDISRRGCGLRTPLGSLSADGLGCIPTLLIVWPEAFQHWSLQAVGPAVMLMNQSRCHPPKRVHTDKYSQYLSATSVCVHKVSHGYPHLTSPGDPPRLAGVAQVLRKFTAFAPWFQCPRDFPSVCMPPIMESLFTPVLGSSCSQALLAF